MQYAEYRKKMIKLASVLSVLKRFRVLIICVCAALVALITTLLCVRGIVYEVSACPDEIVYGEDLSFRAKAVMGGVVYQYSADGENWSETEPVRAGSYKVRAYSKSVTGKPRYGKVHAFVISQRHIEVRAADYAVYGDDPELIAELSFEDSISCAKFTYDDRYAEATEVLPDSDSVKITDKNGADVTSSYVITTVKSGITLGKRGVTVAAESAEKEYDGTPLTAGGYDLCGTTLAAGDKVVYSGCEGERTDAGSAGNVITGEVKIINENGGDVTDRYNLSVAEGTLTVNRRVVCVTTESAEKEYDGTALTCPGFSDDGRLVAGHSLKVATLSSLTAAGEKPNALGFTVSCGGVDKTDNYDIQVTAGTLCVTRRKVTVTTEDMTWVYDGTAHTCPEYFDTDGYVADNEELRATAISSITDVGSVENICEMRAYNYKTNTETTSNYEITVLYGTLKIKAAKLTINSQDQSWVYDGTAHGFNGYTQEGLAEIHTIESTSISQITDVGSCENKIEVKVYAGNFEVTSNYLIEYYWGRLEITRRAVTVCADDAEKVYDGTALTCGTVSGDNLASSHTVTAATYGSRTDAGESANSITAGSVVIRDGNGNAVTSNYDITEAGGTLKVTPRPVTILTPEIIEWIYDGDIHYDTDFSTASTLSFIFVSGHRAVVESYTEICDAGEKTNELTVKIFAGADDKTANYEITYKYGILKVNPRPITVTTEGASKIYDGEELTCGNYALTSILSPALVKDHYEELTFTGLQTVVGTSKNSAEVKILSAADGSDKTSNYEVTVSEGNLTVTPRPVTVISGSGEWVYDGERHIVTAVEISVTKGMGLVTGHKAELSSYTAITDVGTMKNAITVNVLADGVKVTSNYNISYEFGNLKVTKRPVTVTADSAQKQYDGTPLTCGTVSGDNLVSGHFAKAGAGAVVGSQIEVGESKNVIVGNIIIYSDALIDVTSNYSISLATGTLKVTPREITVRAGDAQKIYDGDPLTCKTYAVVSETRLLSGHSLTAVTSGSQTDAGDGVNGIVSGSVKITSGAGADVTACYAVTVEDGVLEVRPRPITVIAGDAEKVYDGTPLTCPDYEYVSAYDPALVKDHELTAVTSGSQTDAGTGENAVESVTITSASGDVTGNYAVIVLYGTLTVTGKKLTVTTADVEITYDGEEHSFGEIDGYEGLLDGHTITACNGFVRKNAGTYTYYAEVRIFNGEDNVTGNYVITYIYGTITINKREVHLTTADGEWVYDGSAHTKEQAEVDDDSPDALVSSHALEYPAATEITEVGEAENKLILSVSDGGGEDVTSNYDLHLTYGTLKVTKRPVTIEYKGIFNRKEIYFTGAPVNELVTGDTQDFYSVSEYSILSGHFFNVIVRCDEYELGAATLYYQEGSARITDRYNKDLTKNYEITLQPCQVEIVQREIAIQSFTTEKIYDGEPLVYEKYEVIDGDYIGADALMPLFTVKGHTLSDLDIQFTGSQTEIGESENSFTVENFKVTDEDGNDVTYGYTPYLSFGSLYVTEFGSLRIYTPYATKIYDGTPLTNHKYEVQLNTLLEGYTFEVTVTGSQTEVGSSPNTFEVVVYSPEGNDVTAGLRLVSSQGLLRVIEREEGGSTEGDLDMSGGIGGGGGDGSGSSGTPGLPKVALKVYSDVTAPVYMRLSSYGDYNGKGWTPANPYTETIDGKYGMNYLTGFALGAAGVQSVKMQVEVTGSMYYLPYYLASGDYGYKVQESDVLYSGSTSAVYSLYYYPYNYLQSGAVSVNSNLSEAELAYRQFVYNNYLSVPESTAAYLATVIAAQGFDITDKNVVAKIAAFVQNSATYNLKYNTALDSEPDAVVSFLRDYKEGVCRHYASAATLIYRMMGIPARYTIGYAGNTFGGEWVDITTDNAHAWVEIYVDGMGWVQIEVTGSSESGYGDINLGTLTPADVTKSYDGTPLVANRLNENAALAGLVNLGFTYNVQFSGSQTNMGTGTSRVESFTLYDPDGRPVLEGVEWTSGEGKLTVVPSGTLITIHLYYLGCEYDGEEHSLGSADWYVEGLPNGFTMDFDPSSIAVRDANGFDWNALKELPVKLCNSFGYEVTNNYIIIFSFESEQGCDGEGIDISRRQLTICTQTAEKEYDGTPLTNGEWWISFGTLADGDRIEVKVSGSITDAGTAENKVESYKIYDKDGRDVTSNYSVNVLCGTLTVID